MKTNTLPKYDSSDNPTNCCPRFKPDGWDEQELHFEDKLFVKAETRSLAHIPLNMVPYYFTRHVRSAQKRTAKTM